MARGVPGLDSRSAAAQPMTMFYMFVTLLIAVLIAGLFGAGFALGCRLPELDATGPGAEDS